VIQERSERAASLVVRAWLEPGRPTSEALRARITYSLDLSTPDQTMIVAGSAEEITAAVSDWLARFLAA
jgi:hypothetical protein